MVADIEKLYKMRDYSNQLSKGIDPTSGIAFPDDSIMNISKIKNHNKEVCKLIDSIIIAASRRTTVDARKIPFFMLEEAKENFQYFEEHPVTISMLCNRINECVMNGMSRVRPMVITRGLTNLGYLEEISHDGEESLKVPTERGSMIGISKERRKNQYGNEYSVNLYDLQAQKFVITNIEAILNAAVENKKILEGLL
jgi:hypothetical protein